MNLDNLKTGDILIRSNSMFGDHYGIFVGDLNGTVIVAENRRSSGIRFVTLHRFLDGKKVIGIEKFDGTEEDRKKVVPMLERLIGKNYDLVRFNCEHFSSPVSERMAARQTQRSLNSRMPSKGIVSYVMRKRYRIGFGAGMLMPLLGLFH